MQFLQHIDLPTLERQAALMIQLRDDARFTKEQQELLAGVHHLMYRVLAEARNAQGWQHPDANLSHAERERLNEQAFELLMLHYPEFKKTQIYQELEECQSLGLHSLREFKIQCLDEAARLYKGLQFPRPKTEEVHHG